LANLGSLYFHLGDYGKCQPLYLRLLQMKEKRFGPDHPEVAHVLNEMARMHGKKGEYEKGYPLLKRSLKIRERTLGREHPEIAPT
ncbi:MAG: tetratricopeptide repeat protein, partial [Nitrospinaceae bacterium]|nr:tetratricopeptide repeat protein [Nitrospinaceae bacterium]NIR53763.1 tetratricopeptide repeat protein [Nitrospinaceae bacterium]NIS84172.1 tetratricopeptide repeat protein [Nitrospinaceae bacterium]NIT80978.1 tetratricopeptide repeat protein [Nitrospinaceae bacterium]NIU43268.1 tetratricopeptide repeat protein [Nitrospinaceae bacterium]